MILQNVNRLKLSQELVEAGIIPQSFIVQAINNDDLNGAKLTFTDDVDMQLVQQIIDAHDPTPIPPQPTQDDFLLDLELRMTMLELGLTL